MVVLRLLLQGALGLSGTVGAPGVAGQQVTGNKTLRLNCRFEHIMYILYISDEPTVQFKGLLLLLFFFRRGPVVQLVRQVTLDHPGKK